MNRLFIPATLMGLLFAAANVAGAATYYVSTTGNNSGSGSSSKPWLTLAYAATRVAPGDIVNIKAGTYYRNETITGCKGTAAKPITFQAYGGTVTIDGSATVTNWRSEGGGRYSVSYSTGAYQVWSNDRLLMGLTYVSPFDTVLPTPTTLVRGESLQQNGRIYVRLFDDSDPRNSTMRVSKGNCIQIHNTQYTVWRGINTAWGAMGYRIDQGSNHNLIVGAAVHHHTQGIDEIGPHDIWPSCQYNTFQQLDIHHIGLTNHDHGVYTQGYFTSVLGCNFHQISGAAIHAYNNNLAVGPSDGLYDGNTISNPLPFYSASNFVGPIPPDPTSYYYSIVSYGIGRHRITNNVIYGAYQDGIVIGCNDNKVLNNTMDLDGGTGVYSYAGVTGTQIANNIIQTSGYYVCGTMPSFLDYNGYFGGRGWIWDGVGQVLSQLQLAGLELNSIVASPLFVDEVNGDYHLQSLSPMRNTGIGSLAPAKDMAGTARPIGGGVDRGAYENP
jgi:hypothetical protein